MLENPVHTARVPDGCDEHHQIQLRMCDLQLLLNIVSIVLINIQNDELLRLVSGDLPAELRADRSAAACHAHDLVLHIADDGADIHLHRFSAEQILDLHITQLADADLSVYKLIHAGERPYLAAGLGTDGQNFLHLGARHARHRDNNLVYIVERAGFPDFVPPADDFDALNVAAPLESVIIDDAADGHRGEMAADDLLDDDIGGFAGADDHDRDGIVPVLPLVLHGPQIAVGEAADKLTRNQEKGIEKIIALRHGLVALHAEELQENRIADAGQNAGDDQILQLLLTGVGPETVIHPKHPEQAECHENTQRHKIADGYEERARYLVQPEIVADNDGKITGKNHTDDIVDHQRCPPP